MATLPRRSRQTNTSRVEELVNHLFKDPIYVPLINVPLTVTQEVGRGKYVTASDAVVTQKPMTEGKEKQIQGDAENDTITQEPTTEKKIGSISHEKGVLSNTQGVYVELGMSKVKKRRKLEHYFLGKCKITSFDNT